ncbi:putative zinc metalloprotease [Lyophyllum shimeji]|uniref:Disintegrin and metalloproteinase domain-containing protein B n=1 Tax=Lyophyllum shimeji TaxID=47721 RepID=A0A9P3PI69_LYOSH|nr:putative zinc metalloprotease [Lyophyllum shimeji]
MRIFTGIISLVVLLLVSWSSKFVHAHSAPARPLKRLVHPSTLALEIVPRQAQQPSSNPPFSKRLVPPAHTLRHDDTFRLTISAFDETYYLHLRPNDHLIHPAARVNYYSTTPNGESYLTHSEPLLRESVKAYWGEVIAAVHTDARLREDAAGAVPMPHPSELGWVRIIVHHHGDMERGIPPEFEGAFSVLGVVHHIMTKDNYLRTKHELDPDVSEPLGDVDGSLVIWRESDVMTAEEERVAKRDSSPSEQPGSAHSCGHDRLPYNTDPLQNLFLQKPLVSESWFSNPLGLFQNDTKQRRDDVSSGNGGMGTNFIDTIGSPDGCPKSQKVLFMGVAADCNYVSKYGSQDNATKQILTDWNSASSLYKSTFNVSLGIVEVQVQSPNCPATADPALPWNVPCSGAELDARLSLFSQWRGNKGDDGVGLWHLMSGCPTGSEVGIAWLATLCQQDATGNAQSVVSGTAVSTAGRTEWQVVAHEIGHNFGAIHDCADGCNSTSACCPLSGTGSCDAKAQFIMSPVALVGEKVFSPCSLGNICSVMKGVAGGRTNTTCLVDPDPTRQTISLQMCGNGIVEAGEDCDPGKGVQSACCDTATCKFKRGAVCDPESSPCCTDQCTFAPATQVCRPSRDSRCDTAETCTGNSSSCPTDVVAPNGQTCGPGDLKCASGQCTSIALQCQTIGASMGLKQACPNRNDNSCQVSCQDPTKSNQCILLTSLLIDGSTCGYGGTCVAGKCQAASFLDTAKAWYTQNLQIAIPVTIVAGLVTLLILWGIARAIAQCCGYRKRPPLVSEPALAGVQHQRLESYDRNAGYPTAAPPSLLPPGTPSFLQPANASYSRVPPERQYRQGGGGGGYSDNHANWVDPTVYNGR